MNGGLKKPENTNLNLIQDKRSGIKLEIVIPVFNEENRIDNILNYYKEFDIVLLDGGSTDQTINKAIESGVTVYSRVGEACGENHFTYYVNFVSKSGYCFYMMADELIDINNLTKAAEHLKNKNTIIGVRKIEWIYGAEPKIRRSPSKGMPRGFCKGFAIYDPYNLHNSLLYNPNDGLHFEMIVYDLHHLHIKNIKKEYGKYGGYIDIEIKQLIQTGAPISKYCRKFIIPIFMFIFWRAWFNNTKFQFKVFKTLELSVYALLALMCWIEQKFFPSIEKQSTGYSSKYLNE